MSKSAWALAPALSALAFALAWQSGWFANPVVYVRADLGTLVLAAGLGASVIIALVILGRRALTRRTTRAVHAVEASQAEAHRRFMRRLDHEIKNPLTAIRAGLANLNGREDHPALQTIHGQVDRLARLSGDLRKLADIETHPLEQEPVNLADLLSELIALEQDDASRTNRVLTLNLFQTPWPLSHIAGDRDLLLIAFHNLVENAIKFSRPQDKIEVRAFEDGAFVAIEVADTGPGISEDELPHLEEELYRGATAKGVAGSGLGLAIVRAIVHRHSGTLNIRSRLGQGTVVTVRLPVAR
ncbi:MAG: HAMP domain-containing histidine kinase [Chloroflexi bacterium]|nr:HAMP domain-containing histidine kinase [Chloroflexota bacterium]